MKKALLIAMFVFLPSIFLFAKVDKKVLIYYFKNISGDDSYSAMTYKLPIYIYTNMKQKINDRKFYIIDEEGLKRYMEKPTYDLWESDLLLDIARLRGIQEVIFGQFYIENGKPVILGKIFYIKSGLILEIGKEYKEYYDILKETEQQSLEKIMSSNIDRKDQVYKPRIEMLIKSEIIQVHNNLSISGGVAVPMDDWHVLFDSGLYGEIFYNLFPRIDVFPLGFGLCTGFVYMSRDADEYYKETDLVIFPVGVLVRYLFGMKGFINGITIDFSGGMSISELLIGDDHSRSIDPYMKISLSLILNPIKDHYISLKFGYMNVSYKDRPFNSLIGDIGVIFYF